MLQSRNTGKQFDIPCRISVEQSFEHFHAHVELAEDVAIRPGDKVRVHGAPIRIAFGETAQFERTATVTRAGPIAQALTRLAAYFDLRELYEVSFNPGRIR
ncbi:hypothetical protein [Alteriqipengyuania lutimaris]|uniref:Uncharacterized protein n=1 Tax=Alteriqipengyuania lutimaris TaxID=1538146 RepID=A0A395LKK6_9SPHN|nr:hypothetical protein [Alteriqipengyuania lutimaris]MBB3033774.1 hypothetical protein [Alteriqipengyuania lutimaris]RDS77245.1 hypothetical protein DL238_06210 [Alteriqipengyuania lutimaris]